MHCPVALGRALAQPSTLQKMRRRSHPHQARSFTFQSARLCSIAYRVWGGRKGDHFPTALRALRFPFPEGIIVRSAKHSQMHINAHDQEEDVISSCRDQPIRPRGETVLGTHASSTSQSCSITVKSRIKLLVVSITS